MSEIKRNLRRVVKITPTIATDDNDDNHVAFNWTEIPNACSEKGVATMLQSVAILDADDSGAPMELIFAVGQSDGSAPSGAQKLGHSSAAVDITAAEAQAVQICGNVQMTLTEGDLLTAQVITTTNIGLVMQPHVTSDSLYVAGVWRGDPSTTAAADSLDIYLGFED
tara:strand:- start:318 stop:818 length:501 start_codon:yes stop_codon:yes gene_type:complete